MAPGATGIRPWRRARFPPCARSSVPEESAPETFPADFLRRQYRESGSLPGYSAGSASSAPAEHRALFGKPSWCLAPIIPISMIGIIENASALPKQLNSRTKAGPVISANYRWMSALKKKFLCKTLHFRQLRVPRKTLFRRIDRHSAQAQNLDRDVVRTAAFPRQLNQFAARFFRALVVDGVKNLRVAHLPPQSVAADQEHVLRTQRLRPAGRVHDE